MKTNKLPCGIGDMVWYINDANKFKRQPKHYGRVAEIKVRGSAVIFKIEGYPQSFWYSTKAYLNSYGTMWFTDKKEYDKYSYFAMVCFKRDKELSKKVMENLVAAYENSREVTKCL